MLTVLVVAADPLVRAGLAALLSAHEVTVIAELSPEDDAEAFVDASLDAVVWEGSETPPRLLVPLLVLITEGEEVNGALEAGATGVLYRTAEGERMVAALQAMVAGLVALEPALTELLGAETREGDAPFGDLTPREAQVLGLLSEGLSNKGIAKRLEISEHTVKFHVNALLGKFGARTRTEVVARAVGSGLVTL